MALQISRLPSRRLDLDHCSVLVVQARLSDLIQQPKLLCLPGTAIQLLDSPCSILVKVLSPQLAVLQNPQLSKFQTARFFSSHQVLLVKQLPEISSEKVLLHSVEIWSRVKPMFMLAKVHSSVLVVVPKQFLLPKQKAQFSLLLLVEKIIHSPDLLLPKVRQTFMELPTKDSQDLSLAKVHCSASAVLPNLQLSQKNPLDSSRLKAIQYLRLANRSLVLDRSLVSAAQQRQLLLFQKSRAKQISIDSVVSLLRNKAANMFPKVLLLSYLVPPMLLLPEFTKAKVHSLLLAERQNPPLLIPQRIQFSTRSKVVVYSRSPLIMLVLEQNSSAVLVMLLDLETLLDLVHSLVQMVLQNLQPLSSRAFNSSLHLELRQKALRRVIMTVVVLPQFLVKYQTSNLHMAIKYSHMSVLQANLMKDRLMLTLVQVPCLDTTESQNLERLTSTLLKNLLLVKMFLQISSQLLVITQEASRELRNLELLSLK